MRDGRPGCQGPSGSTYRGHVRPLRLGVLSDDPRRAVRGRRGAGHREASPTTTWRRRAEMPVVAVSRGQRVLDLVRWGLVPSWAKDLSIGDRQINARAESVDDEARVQAGVREAPRASSRPTASTSGRRSRARRQKQPWFIRRRDGEPLAFAGLWEIWHDPNDRRRRAARPHASRSSRPTPNELLQPIHDRMPVVLPESEWDRWLDPEFQDVDALQQLLVPAPADEFETWPVVDARQQGRQQRPRAARAGRSSVRVMEHARVRRGDPPRGRRARPRPRARRASTRRLPSCPEWTVADLLGHVGRIHRWVTRDRARRGPSRPDATGARIEPPAVRRASTGSPTAAAALADALRDGAARRRGVDVDARSHRAASGRGAWRTRSRCTVGTRRRAVGEPQPIDRELAVDGIQEVFDIMPARLVRQRRRRAAARRSTCTAPTAKASGCCASRRKASVVTREHAKGDVAARGTASDLLLLVWGRIGPDAVDVFGDAALLARWQELTRFDAS